MRRFVAAALLALLLGPLPAAAQDDNWHHGLSLFGDLKYGPDFKHYDSANPDAPKGGSARLGIGSSFDTLNVVPTNGTPAAGLSLVYQSLMTRSADEAYAEYGEIAEAVKYPKDISSVTYRLNAKARWNDGQPVTPDDVVWSFDAWKANNVRQANYYSHVVKAQASGEHEVTFTFDKPGNRELPQIVGELVVLPKHWWTANGPDGKPRDISQTSFEPPLGSGAYRVKSADPGRSLVLERVKDWWGADLPTAKGLNNFDELHYEFFQDRDVMREAFKGDAYDFRVESSAKDWATAYDIPAVADNRLIKEMIPDRTSGRMQAFGFNLRRAKFADIRVRRAFNLVFDFEEMNRTIFFNQYKRIDSYFAGLDLASSGLPQGEELAILQELKDKLPPEVFTTPFANPVNGTDEARRANLRAAFALLKQAGWEIRDRKLTNVKSGEVMSAEVLLDNPTFERVALLWKPGLERLGIAVTIRSVDTSQFQKRQDSRDFDLIMYGQGESQSPGNEQKGFWSSQAADVPGSDNIVGIKDPAVDALIDRVIFAKSRDELVAATKALDRVLLAGAYVVPHWYLDADRLLYWNRFGRPATLPSQSASGGFPQAWWWDAALAAKTGLPK